MTLPFWPKLAAVSDAPNYRPTAGDAQCGTCSYFRALNDGGGYCEKFSFEAEPESVCDAFLEAGRAKVASVYDTMSDLAKNPVARRIGMSAGAGALAGAGVGARGSGEDAGREIARGAAAGATAGAVIGGIGPVMRAARLRSAFQKDMAATTSKLKSDLGAVTRDLSATQNRAQDIKQRLQRIKELRKTKGVSDPETLAAIGEYKEIVKEIKPNELRAALENLRAEKKRLAEELGQAQKRKFTLDLDEVATPKSSIERYGAPALSALVGGGLGFGVSHRSKEQEKFRSSKN